MLICVNKNVPIDDMNPCRYWDIFIAIKAMYLIPQMVQIEIQC